MLPGAGRRLGACCTLQAGLCVPAALPPGRSTTQRCLCSLRRDKADKLAEIRRHWRKAQQSGIFCAGLDYNAPKPGYSQGR